MSASPARCTTVQAASPPAGADTAIDSPVTRPHLVLPSEASGCWSYAGRTETPRTAVITLALHGTPDLCAALRFHQALPHATAEADAAAVVRRDARSAQHRAGLGSGLDEFGPDRRRPRMRRTIGCWLCRTDVSRCWHIAGGKVADMLETVRLLFRRGHAFASAAGCGGQAARHPVGD